jgi:hypothetical protein
MGYINVGRTIKQIESSNSKKHDDIIRNVWRKIPLPLQEIFAPVALLLWIPYISITPYLLFWPNVVLTYIIEYEHKRDDKGNRIKC